MPQEYATADRPDLAPVEFEPVETVDKPTQAVATRAPIGAGDVVPVSSESNSMADMMRTIIMNPQIPMERVQQAWEFTRQMDEAIARKAYNAAIAAARAEIPPILKNRRVNFTSSKGTTDYKHEDLAGIAAIVDPILGRHGLSYRFRTNVKINEPVMVTCIVSHRLGYAEENTLPGPRDESGNKNALQAMGSAITYLQRYTLKAALGLSSAHDDDGRAAGMTEPGAGTIDEDQQIWLREALEHPAQDQEVFCKYFNIERLSDLPASEFERAKTAIAGKLATYNKRKS